MSEAPTNIRALQSDQLLELAWPDQSISRLPYRYIRGECPCAGCRDEWTGDRILRPDQIPADLKLEGMEAIGNYAVRFTWSDGHGSGIFTWELLERLKNECPVPSIAPGSGSEGGTAG
jgi:DUF971 family protein